MRQNSNSLMRSLALVFCLAAPAFAGEYAVLWSGARLYADRHESDSGKVRLYKGEGFIELKADQVQSFEAEEPRPVVAAAPPPAPPVAAVPAAKTPSTLHELADAAA